VHRPTRATSTSFGCVMGVGAKGWRVLRSDFSQNLQQVKELSEKVKKEMTKQGKEGRKKARQESDKIGRINEELIRKK
jgi:hypothetical protein